MFGLKPAVFFLAKVSVSLSPGPGAGVLRTLKTTALRGRRSPKRQEEVSAPVSAGDEVVVDVESLTNLGDGVARYEDYVLLIPYALPGERVTCRVWRTLANYGKADLLEVSSPSPSRAEPRCPLFGDCGGCQYQHLTLEGQRHWKRIHVEDVLRRVGGVPLDDDDDDDDDDEDQKKKKIVVVAPVVGGQKDYGYRSKLTPHYDVPSREGVIGAIGFNSKTKRSRLVDVEECPIATEAINAALPGERVKAAARVSAAVAAYARDPQHARKPRGATLLLRHHEDGVATVHADVVRETVAGLTFAFKAGDFWQNNPEVLPLLVAHVTAEASVGDPSFLVDCYCGGGLFALCAARAFFKVAGLEISDTSIASAKANAQRNNVSNARFLAGPAEDLFRAVVDDFPGRDTAVIVDPPRAGCSEDFLRQLLAFAPRTIVYVSCDPATQARDAAVVLESNYRVTNCVPFDLFPQTRHIENCLTFRRHDPPT